MDELDELFAPEPQAPPEPPPKRRRVSEPTLRGRTKAQGRAYNRVKPPCLRRTGRKRSVEQQVFTANQYRDYLRISEETGCMLENFRGTMNNFCKQHGMQAKSLKLCLKAAEKYPGAARTSVPVYVRPSRKVRETRSARSGRVAKLLVTPDVNHLLCFSVDETLEVFVLTMIGEKPEVGKIDQELEINGPFNGVLYHKQRVYISYDDLVDEVEEKHEKLFYALPDKDKERNWYKRIQRWCDGYGLSLRTPNATTIADPAKAGRVAAEVDRLLDDVREEVYGRISAGVLGPVEGPCKLAPHQYGNIDETSCAILALNVLKTLAYRGQKYVPKEDHHDSRLYLSIPCFWWGTGELDYIVVWTTDREDLTDADRWREFVPEGREDFPRGIMFFEAYSKWSNQESYHRILRYFMTMDRDIKLVVDDKHTGHGGRCPDYFCESIGAKRLQVPKTATWAAQTADQAPTNCTLKRLLRKAMRRWKLRKRVREERTKQAARKLPASLTNELKQVIAEVLVTVREQMNTEERKKGTRKAFASTILAKCPGNKPTTRLAVFLSKKTEIKVTEPGTYVCERCWHDWKTDCNGYKFHDSLCWFCRPELLPPILGYRSAANMNSRWSPGLVAVTEAGNFFLGRERNAVFEMHPNKNWEPKLGDWWNDAPELEYRRARDSEEDYAYRHDLL